MHNALHALCPFALQKCHSLKMTFLLMPFIKMLFGNVLSEMPFQICPSSKCLFGNANSNMPFQKCPFKNALSHFALYQIAVYHKCNIFIYFRL